MEDMSAEKQDYDQAIIRPWTWHGTWRMARDMDTDADQAGASR